MVKVEETNNALFIQELAEGASEIDEIATTVALTGIALILGKCSFFESRLI